MRKRDWLILGFLVFVLVLLVQWARPEKQVEVPKKPCALANCPEY